MRILHMAPRRLCRLVWLWLLLVVPAAVAAQPSPSARPVAGPVPAWVTPVAADSTLAADTGDIDGGAFARLYVEQHNILVGATYRHVVRQIVSSTGVQQYSQLSVDYAPAYQRLILHTVCVLRGNQVFDELDLRRVRVLQNEKDLESFLYTGIYTAYLPLADVRPGDCIEYAYTIQGTNPALKDHYSTFLYYNSGNPIGKLYISVLTDDRYPLSWRCFNALPPPHVESRGKQAVYSWSFVHREPYEGPDNVPSWYDGSPYCQVSTVPSWGAAVQWALRDFAQAARSPTLETHVSEWKGRAKTDTLEYIRLASRFVQDQIRYLGVEMGVYSHQPHTPAVVLAQRYGDCKDKALLLSTFLGMDGVDAAVALVNTSFGTRLGSYLPGVTLFDHAIVTYRWHGKRYWLDPTIAYQRGPVTASATPDYGMALIVAPGGDSLTTMQVPGPGRIDIVERFHLPAPGGHLASLEVRSAYSGGEADDIRSRFRENSLREIQKRYLDYYKNLYTHVTRKDSLQVKDDPGENKIVTTEGYFLKNPWGTPDSTQAVRRFYAYAESVQDRLPDEVPEGRTAPVFLPGPYDLHFRLQVITPRRWNLHIRGYEIVRGAYRYSYQPSQSGDTINIDYRYQTFSDVVAADSAEILNRDIRLIKSDLTLQLSGNGNGSGGAATNWFSVLLGLVSLVAFAAVARGQYHRSLSPRPFGGTPRRLGGWLILLGAGLTISPFALLYQLLTGGFYAQSLWDTVNRLGAPALAVGMVFVIVANHALLVLSVFVCVLFYKRRDIFPRVCIFMFCFNVVLLLVDSALTTFYFPARAAGDGVGIFRGLAAAFIWVPYLLVSKRVRETFVYPASGKLPEPEVSPVDGLPGMAGAAEAEEPWALTGPEDGEAAGAPEDVV